MTKQVLRFTHWLIDTETLFHKLKCAKSFSMFDLSLAFYQIELYDEAQKCAISKTIQGLN